MFAALDSVRAKYDRRTKPHLIRSFKLGYILVGIAAFFRHKFTNPS